MPTDERNAPDLHAKEVRLQLPSGATLAVRKPPGRRAVRMLGSVEALLGPLYMAVVRGEIGGVEVEHIVGAAPAPLATLMAMMTHVSEHVEAGGPMAEALLRWVPLDELVAADGDGDDAKVATQLAAMLGQVDRVMVVDAVLELFAGRVSIVLEPGEPPRPDQPDVGDELDLQDLLAFTAFGLVYAYRPS